MRRKILKTEEELDNFSKKHDRLAKVFLHSCCAPCSSAVLEYLRDKCDLTLFYFNPNISRLDEYEKRLTDVKKIADIFNFKIIFGKYDPDLFFGKVKGLECEPEGGARCGVCFRLRLSETAKIASESSYDFFTTTLSVSPHKNSEFLNSIAGEEGDKNGIAALYSDFKKNNGYKRSTELSGIYNLYRQNYCGCVFSEVERKR